MKPTPPSLPESWVERIWSVMRATYGAEFDRQWEVPVGVDPVQHVGRLKGFWARELGRYLNDHAAIIHGLENLPPRPPNLVEFRAICNRRPDAPVPALDGPLARPPAEVVEAMAAVGRAPSCGPRDWAARLLARQAAGERLSHAQRDALRSVRPCAVESA